jgi:hypothetical protein
VAKTRKLLLEQSTREVGSFQFQSILILFVSVSWILKMGGHGEHFPLVLDISFQMTSFATQGQERQMQQS